MLNDPGDMVLDKRVAIIGAFLGPILLYITGDFRGDAFSTIDYFWSIPAGAVTGFLLPSAWPEKKE